MIQRDNHWQIRNSIQVCLAFLLIPALLSRSVLGRYTVHQWMSLFIIVAMAGPPPRRHRPQPGSLDPAESIARQQGWGQV